MANILAWSKSDLEAWFVGQGEKRFRVSQVWQWLWGKGAKDFGQMTNLSLGLRENLKKHFYIYWPKIERVYQSKDGTYKFLILLEDGQVIETVLIPEKDHYTLCVSSQVGCSLACTFCHTGQMGFVRNLRAYEIVSQVILAKKFIAEQKLSFALRNIVYMGMGEPLLNWSEVKKSLGILLDENTLNYSKRRITVSSVGIPKVLEEFARSGLAMVAISLHAPSQTLRKKLMPKAARYELSELIQVLQNYPLKPRERITIEYVLLKDVNDTPAHALELVKLLKKVRCKINLIRYNPWPGSPYQAPEPERILSFEKILWDNNFTAILRKSKGDDILAACGQLRATEN
ncbi:MAG: 23S rRNA (adenine(2503)-C(2))-methyltransferase RlmN [Desulfonauticus sp.]|nr:23S rRNA (adenine(2503)-C(2))-methyltransferase RlmN [Desulfonauticus sp.]